jgi:hypothetical protein
MGTHHARARKGAEDVVRAPLTVIVPLTVLYRRQRWVLPSGETVVAALPKGVTSHFGPELKRFVLSQYHQGQITVPRLAALLADLGIDISKRQIVRLLSAKQDTFLAEAIEALREGLACAFWITVDDTCAQVARRAVAHRLNAPGTRPGTASAPTSATIASRSLQPRLRRAG